jgi:hypothetical protein
MWQCISCDEAKKLRSDLTLRGRGNWGGDFTTTWKNQEGEVLLRDHWNMFQDTCSHEVMVPDAKPEKRPRKPKPPTTPACTR